MVEGLEDERFALISKTHHALVDGVSGVDLMTMLFDLDAEAATIDGAGAWVPAARSPSGAELAAASLHGRRAARSACRCAAARAGPPRPHAAPRRARPLERLGEVVRAGIELGARHAAERRASARTGASRSSRRELDDFKLVKDALGGTVNDVVLAVVAGALRALAAPPRPADRGPGACKACVPVSIRARRRARLAGQPHHAARRAAAGLPRRPGRAPARRARGDGRTIKDSKQALGAEMIAGMQDFAPPTMLAQASRLNFSTRFFNLLVTNIPGPQFPLYLLGRELQAMFPVAFLAGDRALAIAVMSYNGGMSFGLIGDLDAMADIEVVAEGITHALRELTRLAA